MVVGGGVTGLTAAHRLLAASFGLSTAGRGDRPGGQGSDRGASIWTIRATASRSRAAPDSFITNKPWGLDLCERLGLGDRLIETDARHRRSFVVRKGRLVPVPEGFVLMAPAPAGAAPDHAGPLVAGQAPDDDGPVHPPHGTTTPRRAWRRSSAAGWAARRSTGWSSRWSAGSTRPTPTT